MKTINFFLILIIITSFSNMNAHSQQKQQESFSTNEFVFVDTNFFTRLSHILCNDTIFEINDTSIKNFTLVYDSSMAYIDPFTNKPIIANLRVTELIDGNQILMATNNGNAALGFFYLKSSIVFVLNSTNRNFFSDYLNSTGKKKQFSFYQSPPIVGGGRDAFFYLTQNNEIHVVKIFNYE